MTEIKPDRKPGFTLIELVIAVALSTLVIAGMVTAFTHHRKTYWTQKQVTDVQQNVRAAISMIARDARMAGYGVTVAGPQLSQWFTWGAAATGTVEVTQGAAAGDPDQVTLIGAVEPVTSTIRFGTSAGDTTLNIDIGTGSEFNTTTKKVVFVGRMEMARVVGVSGDQLTVSTDPTVAGVGLKYAYPSGTPVELVKQVTYSTGVDTNQVPDLFYVMRDDNTGDLGSTVERIIAVSIEDFQITQTTNSVTLEVTGRTPWEDDKYTHPTEGDGFRRETLTTKVYPRNQ